MTRRLSVVVAAGLLLAATNGAVCSAAVFIPSKTSDGADGACDADCSLREAVLAANARDGEDVVLLRAGSYRLLLAGAGEDAAASGDLDVLGDLVILGDGAATTIVDGAALDRLFDVPVGASLELRDLTLRNGRAAAGGAVRSAGRLTLLRTVLADNRAAGGASAHGGAVHSSTASAELIVDDSSFTGNSADGSGGAIASSGHAELRNLTVTGNSAGNIGGGIFAASGGVFVGNNLTIAGNVAAGPGGGGIATDATPFLAVAPKLRNSIVANNSGGHADCFGDFDTGYVLVGRQTASCHGPATAKHDLVGTPAAPLDAKLGSVGGNGGPTPTLPLLAGSPAINAGDPAPPGSSPLACASSDQRGAARPAGARCDLGAFEVTTACVAGGNVLCLEGGRFKVTARWQTAQSGPQPTAAPAATVSGQSGYFWLLDVGNVEVTAKVVDGCAANDRFWFFASGMTRAFVELTVTDTKTGAVKKYTNPRGRIFRSILDFGAFACG